MQEYNKIILYYFTGTGNALKAARWICEQAAKRKIICSMHAIDAECTIHHEKSDSKTLIGVLSPTHGFNVAPIVLKFLKKFPNGNKGKIFILNTRAGLKFSKIFFPGLSGAAQFLPMFILKLKGYKIAGGLPLDMPSNWLFFHPGLHETAVAAISGRCEIKTNEFIHKILDGKKVFLKMLISLPFDIAVLPITVGYYFYGRFILAKTMIYTSNCNSCMVCVNHCPIQAIKVVYNRPYWSYSCESCMRCVNICPQTSIQTSHLIFVFVMIFPGWLFNKYILNKISTPMLADYPFVYSASKMALTLFLLFLLYRLIQVLLKLRIVSYIFKYTSLSAYWRRYLAPGISIKDYRNSSNKEK